MRKNLLFLNRITLPNQWQRPKSRGLFSFAFFLLFFQFAQAQIEVTFDVTEPTCFGHPTGSATAIVTGGIPPYTYVWNNGTMGPTISNVTAGTYTVTVSDSGGAISIKNVTITQPTLVQVTLTANVCEIPIVITAVGSGGIPGYEYNWSTGQTGPVISVPNPGTYCVTMTDQNLCGATKCITVDVNPLDVDVVATNVSCPGENDGQVQAIPSGGTPPYTYQWSNGATTQVVTGLSTGTYTVTVTDAAGCMAEASGTVSAPPPLVATATSAEGVCPGESNGSAMASGSGGTPPYTYEWNTGATTQVITGLSPGTYTVTVTDSNDCEAVASTTIQQYPGVTVIINGTEVICGAEDAGSATATPTAGTAPFTYQWSTGATTQTITDLPEGTFSVTVTDANGCTGTAEIGITIIDDFILDIVIQNPLCPGDATGSILAEGWGGTPPYIYEWSTGLTGTPLLENVGAGNYSVTVTDQNGCQLTEDFTLVDPAAVEVSISGTAKVCPGEFTGVATAMGSGGTQPYTYEWSTGATTQMITGLGAGTYTVTLTDANDCEAMASVTIGVHEGVTAVIVGTDLVCGVDELGMATATATSGTPPFTYLWNTGATTQVINNLPAGTYSVTITDSNGCTDSDDITIDIIDDFILDIVIQNPRCPEEETGSILAEGWGGTPPYMYEWSTGLTSTPLLENVGAGTYSVTVTDQNGCQLMETFTLTDPPALIANISGSGGVCPGENTGSAMAMGMGGTPPYSYEWNTGATMQMLFGLSAGTYSVTITDANDCEAEASVVIEAFEGVTAVVTGTEVVCDPDGLGEATASATSGTPPFTYEWSNGAITPTISNLPAGTYSVTITDANGCTDSAEITIIIVDDFMLDVMVQNPLCPGDENGSILAEGMGGTPPYLYQWSTGLTSSPLLENVGAGTYSVTVTDQNGCKLSQEFTLVDPPLLSVNVTSTTDVCPGESDGSATAVGMGGTPPYTYEWSTGATTQTINNLSAGTYTVTVTDANECEATAQAVIEAFEGVTVEVTGMNIVCAPGLGIAAAEATSGTPPFSYLWSTGATTQTIMNLPAGTYGVTVTDANGCKGTDEIIIEIIDDLEVDLAPRDVLCFGDNTGSVLAQASGGRAPYTYLWSTGATANEIINVPAGTYSVTVTDANGCTATASATVNEPPALDLDLAVTDVSCPGEDDGQLVITAAGGTPPYTYFVNGMEVPGNVVTGLSGPATLNVTVRDANFCEVSGSITLDAPDEIELTLSPVDLFCAGDMSGAITSTVSGGTMPYTYAWSNGATTTNLSNVAAGTYTLTVTDANGCTATATTTVNEPAPIVVMLETTDVLCVDNDSGAITSMVSGGTAPYTYEWSNGATTANISNLAPGTYTVTVTDANECEATASATIEFFPGLSLTPIATAPDCFGEMTGAATVVVSGGTPPYTYLWNTGSTDEVLTNLGDGIYEVTVTDAVGCTGTEVIGIVQPDLLVAQVSSVNTQDVSCNGFADGQASVEVMGGTAPYTYLWSDGQTTQTATNLSAGTYTVTVTDANGCEDMLSVTIEEPTAINLNITPDVSGSCAGATDGAATATVSGGTPPYTYAWSNGATTPSISNLAPGVYGLTVTDSEGCTAQASVVISAFPTPTCSIAVTNQVTPFGNDGEATITVMGGAAPFTYLWSNGQTTQTAVGLAPGTYTATVTDANGCETTCSVTLAPPARIGDFVWLDEDRDGIQDPGEPGIPGVMVILQIPGENDPTNIDTTFTDADGFYFFDVVPGEYKVTFIAPGGLVFSPPNQGANDALDSDADPVMGMTGIYIIGPGEINLTIDAGLYTKCDNITDPGVVGPNQFLCGPGNVPDPIVNIELPSGGSGAIEYLWMSSNIPGPFNMQTWQVIPGATGPSYAPGALSETTYFARCARRECCTIYLESNIVIIEVGSVAVADIQGPGFFCLGESETYFAVGTGPGAVVEWTMPPGLSPQTATGTQVNLTASSHGSFDITLQVTENGCTSTDTKTITVTSSPIYCGSPMPLNAEITDEAQGEVLLSWMTEEFLSDHTFTVEYATDGEHFADLAHVSSPAAYLGVMNYYEHEHAKAKQGRNLYRLRIESPEGSIFYSEEAEVIFYGDSKIALLYPNPVEDIATLEIFETFGESMLLELINSQGQQVWAQQVEADTKQLQLNLSQLPAGTYFIKMNYSRAGHKVLKLVKK